jgi:hypothetical protein
MPAGGLNPSERTPVRVEGEGEVRTDVTKVKFVDRDELKVLWRVLERLQADVTPVGGASVGLSATTANIAATAPSICSSSSTPTAPGAG